MIFLYIIIVLLLIFGSRYIRSGYNDEYISKGQCNCVKGFFIVVVFARHIWPYLAKAGYEFNHFGDQIFRTLDSHVGQLLVVMFLFYSGYGVMESIQRKGDNYVNGIPKRRVLPTLLNFDIAIIAFLLLDYILGIKYNWSDTILAFTGWTGVGNSNWYIFVIIACYLITYLAAKLFHDKVKIIGTVVVCSILLWIVLAFTKDLCWRDTMFAYNAGVAFSLWKDKVVSTIQQHYIQFVFISVIAFLLLYIFPYSIRGIVDNALSIAFAAFVMILSMKVRVRSKVLEWLGKNLFPLYIYQRIPMILFSTILGGGIIVEWPELYILLCVCVTLAFAYFYKFIDIRFK